MGLLTSLYHRNVKDSCPMTRRIKMGTMIPMAHSFLKHSLRLHMVTSTENTAAHVLYPPFTPRTDDTNLYNIPSSLSPTYSKIPFRTQIFIVTLSFFISMWKSKCYTFVGKRSRKLWVFTFLLSLLFSFVLKESVYQPSRIQLMTLAQRQWLPSTLSHLDTVHITFQTTTPIHLHYLLYPHTPPTTYNFDILHFNHGFGASSLSWLPVIPKLTQKLNCRLALAHDAPGFGFTHIIPPYTPGNTSSLVPYSAFGNSLIGSHLLKQFMGDGGYNNMALFGHSIGCVGTLYMAQALAQTHPNANITVVLVAPAFLENKTKKPLQDHPPTIKQHKHKYRRLLSTIGAYLGFIVLDLPFQYLLRRTVGTNNFWRNGLIQAWGDPKRLSDTDVLRFQWPSIRMGWEQGLIAFTRSRLSRIGTGDDFALLQQILKLPKCRVIIAHGSKDLIIPLQLIQKIQSRFPDIEYVTFEGQGHDPFEEQPDVFVDKICDLISKSYSGTINDNK